MHGPRMRAGHLCLPILAAAAFGLSAGSSLAQETAAVYEGKAVRIGKGSAHTVVRSAASGEAASIGIVLGAKALEGLPKAPKGGSPRFSYVLRMPVKGPKTVIDHVVIDWESAGHPPPKVYDVPHFDFHFYLVSAAERMKVTFSGPEESGTTAQQPAAELLPAGYVVPPGTAVPGMGVHGVNPGGQEFNGQPFTATFIYGYYNRELTFLEPMASLAYLESKPSLSAPIPRPTTYGKVGAYPTTYTIAYDKARHAYEITLTDLR